MSSGGGGRPTREKATDGAGRRRVSGVRVLVGTRKGGRISEATGFCGGWAFGLLSARRSDATEGLESIRIGYLM